METIKDSVSSLQDCIKIQTECISEHNMLPVFENRIKILNAYLHPRYNKLYLFFILFILIWSDRGSINVKRFYLESISMFVKCLYESCKGGTLTYLFFHTK